MDLAEKVKKDLTEILAKYAAGNAEIVQLISIGRDPKSRTYHG